MNGLERLVGFGKKVLMGVRTVGYAAVASATLISLGGEAKGESMRGILTIEDHLNSSFRWSIHQTNNLAGQSDGYSSSDYDHIYDKNNPSWGQLTQGSKIVSLVDEYSLDIDSRSENGTTNSPVNLILSLVSKSGNSITVSNLENSLLCVIDPTGSGYDFGTKPIYLQQTDSSGNRFGTFYDVREVFANHSGIINLPNLNGTYDSEVPYAYFKLDFNQVPEPSTALLAATGALAVGAWSIGRYLGRSNNGKDDYADLSKDA